MANPYEEPAFWANGPMDKGFFTQGSRIAVGGEFNGTDLGVQCSGPTGVQASGEDFGVQGIGTGGADRAGRGGRFEGARLRAQVQLEPHAMDQAPSDTQAAAPLDLFGLDAQLPAEGKTGDLYMSTVPRHGGVLWLCVRGSGGGEGAEWCQLLLGRPVPGRKAL